MLVVLTRDQAIMDWVKRPESNAQAWPPTKQLSAGSKDAADKQLVTLLKLVKSDEPLCITGHGNNAEVGDEGHKKGEWGWTTAQLASLLGDLVGGYHGPILMEVCSESMTSFAAGLVLALQTIKKLNHVRIYGYENAVDIRHPFPNPLTLDKNLDLRGIEVKF